ncbi:MAG: hypothetical protein JXQ23_02355 [Clostridia bacterium]|nr:hypothetical protein [Clostridia bacterium]
MIVMVFLGSFLAYHIIFHYTPGKTYFTLSYTSDLVRKNEVINIDDQGFLTYEYAKETDNYIYFSTQLSQEQVKEIFNYFIKANKYYFIKAKYTYYNTSKYNPDTGLPAKDNITPSNNYFNITYNKMSREVGGRNAITTKRFKALHDFLLNYINE